MGEGPDNRAPGSDRYQACAVGDRPGRRAAGTARTGAGSLESPDTYGSCQSEARRLRAQGATAMTVAPRRWPPSRPGARRQGLRPLRFASGSGRLGCYCCGPPGERASAPSESLLTTSTTTSPIPCWRTTAPRRITPFHGADAIYRTSEPVTGSLPAQPATGCALARSERDRRGRHQPSATSNAVTLRVWRLSSTPIRWIGSPRPRYLSA